MASEVEICNLALAMLGDSASISSLNEGSAQSEYCKRFYPVSRDTLLELHAWSFASRRVKLAMLGGDLSPPWAFRYARPADAVRVLSVMPPCAADDVQYGQQFVQERGDDGMVILTNQPQAWAKYTARVTDSTQFPPLFTEALSVLLASKLAGPIMKGDAGAQMTQALYRNFMLVMGQAKASDGSQHNPMPNIIPSAIKARGC